MVQFYDNDISGNPSCAHGPTLLFSRSVKGNEKNFFACSAFRDRKLCPFFMWADEKIVKTKVLHYEMERKKILDKANLFIERREKLSNAERKIYCKQCDQSFAGNRCESDAKHEIVLWNSDFCPSKVLKPIVASSGESQYYFNEDSTKTIISLILATECDGLLSVGCPRIHEAIKSKKIPSYFLDLDFRYFQFYDKEEFQWFNLYNSHMFLSDGWIHLKKFLNEITNLVIIADPPFGARVEPLAASLRRIISSFEENSGAASHQATIMFAFPYFMESAVKESLPNFEMLDLKVDYENHPKFKSAESGGRKQGSPIRIFTNGDVSKLKLPTDQYRYCQPCERWVANENKHCAKCNRCTSKNGGEYIHCDLCQTCVKTTWSHCHSCQRCKLPVHFCEKIVATAKKLKREGSFSCERKKKRKMKRSK